MSPVAALGTIIGVVGIGLAMAAQNRIDKLKTEREVYSATSNGGYVACNGPLGNGGIYTVSAPNLVTYDQSSLNKAGSQAATEALVSNLAVAIGNQGCEIQYPQHR